MCVACDLKNGERTAILVSSVNDYKLFMENESGTYRLHMTDGRHNIVRGIYHCLFCGRRLGK